MANIDIKNISDLGLNGNDLFQDSDKINDLDINERLTSEEMMLINGGRSSGEVKNYDANGNLTSTDVTDCISPRLSRTINYPAAQ